MLQQTWFSTFSEAGELMSSFPIVQAGKDVLTALGSSSGFGEIKRHQPLLLDNNELQKKAVKCFLGIAVLYVASWMAPGRKAGLHIVFLHLSMWLFDNFLL